MTENKSVVVDLSKLIEYQKPYADSTLRNMRKDKLIQYIRELEYNRDVAISWNRQQAENVKDWEPVVRCKDCKWYRNGECFCNDVWFNLTEDREGIKRIEANPDDFCSYGERRDDDG